MLLLTLFKGRELNPGRHRCSNFGHEGTHNCILSQKTDFCFPIRHGLSTVTIQSAACAANVRSGPGMALPPAIARSFVFAYARVLCGAAH